MKLSLALSFCSALAVVTARSNDFQFDPGSYAPNDVIIKDVAIIGGGATGSYAGITLSDQGKSIVVVEKSSKLGGHTNTYIDPATGTVIDYGVTRYGNITVVTEFFDRLGVNYTAFTPEITYNSTIYADFSSAQQPANFNPSSNYTPYIDQLKRFPYLSWTTDLPDPVPSDLYLSIGDFITKYSLQDLGFEIYYHFGGSLLGHPTLDVITEFGLAEYHGSLPGGALRILSNHGNHEIYAKVLSDLGSNVLLESTVTAAQRSSSETRLVVKTPNGNKLIIASQLLITIPTILDNMSPFDLDTREQTIFQQFASRGFWTGLVNISGLPAGVQYVNAGIGTLYNIPKPPAVASLTPTTVEGIYAFYFFSDGLLPYTQARKDALASITAFRNAITKPTTDPELVAFSSHSPWRPVMNSDAIANGFWQKMYALQGHRNTWYTGVEFLAWSSQLWNYTQTLVPQIIAAL